MNKIIKYIFGIVIVALIFSSIWLYFSNKSEVSALPEKNEINSIRDELRLGIINYDTINPIESKNIDVQYLDKLIFDSILTVSEDFKLQNNLAEEVAKIDSLDYLIKLKDDIIWHNGEKFNAKDIEYTINNIKKNEKSIYYDNVKNIDKIYIIDENTIKLTLKEENELFKFMLTFPIIKEPDKEGGYLNGTGKYKVINISEKQIILKKTERAECKIDKIIVNLYKKNIELYNAFSEKNIDILFTKNINYEEYLGTIGYKSNICSDREYDYLAINTEKVEKEIREAINSVIDKKNINYKIYNNKFIITDLPMSKESYLCLNYGTNDKLEDARQILMKNGWKYLNEKWLKNNKELSLSLMVENENENRLLVAKEIKEQLETFGINVELIKLSRNNYDYYKDKKQYELLLTGDIISIEPNLNNYFKEENIFNFDNNHLQRNLEEVFDIDDCDVLKKKYEEIFDIYSNEIPFISLYFNSNILIFSDDLRGNFDHNWFNLYYNIDNWYICE